eukprot:94070-Amphidinium_carterae.1
MRAVITFLIFKNTFKGTIPESGIRTMRAMESLSMHTNGLRGVLPESGLQAMKTMRKLFVYANRFAGTLPNRAVAGLNILLTQENGFEGKHRRKMSHKPNVLCEHSFQYQVVLGQELPRTRCPSCSVKRVNFIAFERHQ